MLDLYYPTQFVNKFHPQREKTSSNLNLNIIYFHAKTFHFIIEKRRDKNKLRFIGLSTAIKYFELLDYYPQLQ